VTGRRSPLRRALAAGALLGLALAGCTSREEKLAERIAKSEAYLAENKIPEALIELRGALKLAPTSADINHRIARVLEDQGALADALFFYQETYRLDPSNNDASLSLAKLQMFTDPEASKKLIDDVLEKEPRSILAYIRRSEWQLARADSAAALQAALTATELDPKHVLARIQVGLVHRARIREHALKKEPVPEALYAEALASLDRAIELAKQGAEAEPGWIVRAWIERANVLATWPAREGEASAAYRLAAEMAREWPEQERRALERVLDHARLTRDGELQRWALERRVETDPSIIAFWLELARIADPPDAPKSEVLARMIQQRPTDARAQAAYAHDLFERGSREEAIAHAERMAKETDVPPIVMAEVSRLQLMGGNVEAARAMVARLVEEFPDHPQTMYAHAELQMADGRFQEAVQSLERLIERSDTAETHRMLAEAKLRAGDRAGALLSADRALALAPEPKPLELLLLRGRALVAQRDWDSAVQTFRRAEQLNGGALPPREALQLAQALYSAGRVQGGRAYLNATLAQLKDPPLQAILLFARFEAEREPERARALLEEAAQKYPGDPRVLNRLSQLYVRGGQASVASARLDEAIARSPKAAHLRILRARLRIAQGKLPEATQDAREALELRPDMAGAMEMLVRLLAAQGKTDQARAELEAQDKGGTLRPSSRLLLARLHLVPGGDEGRAIELLEQVLAERSDAPGVKNDLAFLLAKRGSELERARRLAEEARSALPENAQVADTLGFVYLKSNLPAPALDQFRAAIDLVESDQAEWPTFQYHMGLALKALDRSDEAAQAFERALAAAVEFPEAEQTRSELSALRQARAGEGG
jgi:tetratricopeptide (TPR) repeat protein